jgi:peptide/nickel transport system substrate-binding protein
MLRKRFPAVTAVTLLLGTAASLPSFGQTLRIAMTASDIPTTTGIPNNGGEGFRFLGFPAFDGLIDWDFTRPDQIAGLTWARHLVEDRRERSHALDLFVA